ncbi:MAG: hypothetical protein RLZ35_328 [Pseudomonadota bacterium]
MPFNGLDTFFSFNRLSILTIGLILFVGLCVTQFSMPYMKGDTRYKPFFVQLLSLIFSAILMVSANNMLLLFIFWALSNALLVRLMMHKLSWKAAKASGMLAAKNYLISLGCIGSAFILFYLSTDQITIDLLIQSKTHSVLLMPALVLLAVGAMMQSAIWPFHRWLISSLNSPTPVSAIMHAGLINGGGFLLVRFAPLYLQHSILLNCLFFMGLLTAFLGTLWKLMQSDIKRMLACSTMGQMGFMFVQCGLGLFPAAVAHLIWHGIFKAYLFLSSNSAAQEKRFDIILTAKPLPFSCALFCGLITSICFGYITGKSWFSGDTTLVLMVLTLIFGTQSSLSLLQIKPLQQLPVGLLLSALTGLLYGASVQSIAWFMDPLTLMQPQSLHFLHMLGILVLVLGWLYVLFLKPRLKSFSPRAWYLSHYVAHLNASQPDASTITAHRNQYAYK